MIHTGRASFSAAWAVFTAASGTLMGVMAVRMWQNHTRYDPELHMRNQLQHGSWVLQHSPS